MFIDEFMTNKILQSIGMQYISIFYDRFHLKINLEKR